jgi:hypothetical protein
MLSRLPPGTGRLFTFLLYNHLPITGELYVSTPQADSFG